MRTLRKFFRVFAVASVIALSGVATAAPASASLAECSSGWTCGWAYTDYSDLRFEYQYGGGLTPGRDNVVDSVANMGNLDCARLYDGYGPSGKYIQLSRPGLGGTTRDPNLYNGGGTGPYWTENWANRISYVQLYSC